MSFPTALRASFCNGFTLVLNLSRALEALICLLVLYPLGLYYTLIQIVFVLAVEYTNLAGERHNIMFIERSHHVTLPW